MGLGGVVLKGVFTCSYLHFVTLIDDFVGVSICIECITFSSGCSIFLEKETYLTLVIFTSSETVECVSQLLTLEEFEIHFIRFTRNTILPIHSSQQCCSCIIFKTNNRTNFIFFIIIVLKN